MDEFVSAYRSSEPRLTCRRCGRKVLARDAVEPADGPLCARCTGALLPARAATWILGCSMVWYAIEGISAIARYAFASPANGRLPSLTSQLILHVSTKLVQLAAMILVIDRIAPDRRVHTGPLSTRARAGIAGLVVASVGGVAFSLWLPHEVMFWRWQSASRVTDLVSDPP
jgi:hypothetical protein